MERLKRDLGLLHAILKQREYMEGKLAFLLLSDLTDVFLQCANSSESFTL